MDTLTKADAERLAAFLHGIRPDWYPTETMRALGEAAKRAGPPDVYAIAVAAVRCAANPANGSPAHIPRHGSHWQPWPGDSVATPQPAAVHICRTCGGYVTEPEHDEHCARRATDEAYANGAAAAKAALKKAQESERS